MKTRRSITFFWFTHGADAALLEYSVVSVGRAYPEARRVICVDAAAPLPESSRAPLSNMADIRVTEFPRNGNLNGLACVEGILRCLASATTEWAVKIDSDCLVLRRHVSDSEPFAITPFFLGPHTQALFHTHERLACGFMYWLRPEAAERLLSAPFHTLAAHAPHFPEDHTIQGIAQRMFLLRVTDNEFRPGGGWAGWGPGKPVEPLRDFFHVCIGNTNGLPKHVARTRAVAAAKTLLEQP